MTPRQLLAILRQEIFDVAQPYLWPDELLYNYIRLAQRQFCRDSYGIPDARSFKLALSPEAGEWYRISPQILKVRSATRADNGSRVRVVPEEHTVAEGIYFDGRVGPVRALVTGLEPNVVRVYPKPILAETIYLSVFRLPEDVGPDGELELAEHHQYDSLHWAKHLAYSVQDAETYDKESAEKFEKRHAAVCDKAVREYSRASHAAGVVTYGGL